MQFFRRNSQAAAQQSQTERASHDAKTVKTAGFPQPLDPKLLMHVGGAGSRSDAPKQTW